MTLCKFRDERTYDAQFLIERHDTRGLLKKMREAVAAMGEDGLSSTPYYVGALLALETLFGMSEADGEIDTWMDYMALFEVALEKLEGGDGDGR